MKTYTMWCIKHPCGEIMVCYGVFLLRKECIKGWESETIPWKTWYNEGFRAVKVIVKQK